MGGGGGCLQTRGIAEYHFGAGDEKRIIRWGPVDSRQIKVERLWI